MGARSFRCFEKRFHEDKTELEPVKPVKASVGWRLVRFRNGKSAKNQFAVAALTTGQSNSNGTLSDAELTWLIRRARGGYGIVTSCAAHVQRIGQGWEGQLGIFHDDHIVGWKRAADAVHAEGALLIAQAFHAGMRALESYSTFAVSAVDTAYRSRITGCMLPVRGLTEGEIEQLIEDFVAAAKRLEAAGVDGVELHAAHGYILTQFLCRELNSRADKWGGVLENRARLTREVVRRIRVAVSPGFIVGVSLSPEPGHEVLGWSMDPDENVQVAQWLAADGVDFISLSLFEHSPSHVTAKHVELGLTKPLVQVFRDACPQEVVIMACGGISQGSDIKALDGLGVDVAVMGKTAISTPNFPRLVQADPDYKVTMSPPYAKDHLASVDVSPAFIDRLTAMGLVRVTVQPWSLR